MSTYYDLYETPDPSGEGKKRPLHARVRSKGTITAKEFQERLMKEQHIHTPWSWELCKLSAMRWATGSPKVTM